MVAGAAAQHKHEASPSLHISCAPLLNGVGDINHPVSTKNPGPERFFNQGFSLPSSGRRSRVRGLENRKPLEAGRRA
jgi:hypothetical protein